MPSYNPLSESEYNALTEIQYNSLSESNIVYFKTNKVLFDKFGRVSFCPQACDCSQHLGDPSPCTFPVDVQQPDCVIVRQDDFTVTGCASCVTTVAGGVLPLVLWYDGVVLFQTNDSTDTFANSAGIRLYANIQLDTGTCHWVLTVRCKEGASYYDVWVGEKTYGKTPVGTYQRTSGCETIVQMQVQ